MKRNMIGILAGMGPHSTAPFINLVVKECQAQYGAKDDIDFPKMMVYSLPTPFFTDRPTNHSAMETTLCHGLKELERTGVEFIAIACNTAHVYYPKLSDSIHVSLLNMVTLTVASIPKAARRVALIASRPTVESGIYQKEFADKRYELADIDWQSQIDQLIESIKVSADPTFFKRAWERLFVSAIQAGADTIVIACLDLSAISMHMGSEIRIVDASRCLASEVVKQWILNRDSRSSEDPSTLRNRNFVLSSDQSRLQLDRIHRFLSNQAYWSLNIPLQTVKSAIQNSLCFGLYDEAADNAQVGFARVVTDYVTFAWLCDVYVEPVYRGRGLARWMIGYVMDSLKQKGLRRICLATKDAHDLYSKHGFQVTQTPGNWMEIKDNDIYK